MISFDLICENGHTFEGWFSNSKDFEKQSKTKSIECPSAQIIKFKSFNGYKCFDKK